MRITIITASNRQPTWVTDGFDEYARRLRGSCTLTLVETPLARRARGQTSARAIEIEGARMLQAVPKGARVVALDATGTEWSTSELAAALTRWLGDGAPLALMIGGPDGLSPACLARSVERWALSRLTLPHGLARLVAAEALYRAWSVRAGHPYHRA